MLKQMLEGNINFKDSVSDWKEAIIIAAQPLLRDNYITQIYIDTMVQNVIDYGPYIVIIPNLAIPHAKSGTGVLKTGLSLLLLEEKVIFPEDNAVRLLIVLAACDSETHLEVISELTDIIMDDDVMERIYGAKAEKDILECLS